jgi:hypothetical protein
MEVGLSERSVIGVFGGLVVAGLLLGLAAVLLGGPQPGSAPAAGTQAAQQKAPVSADASPTANASSAPAAEASATTPSASTSATDTEDALQQPMDQPARMGARLDVVDNPPPDTIAILDEGSATPGSTYAVTFAPYGLGPGDGQSQQLVVKVLSSTSQPGVRKPFQFSGHNALVNLAADANGVVVVGGQYQGTITLVDRQGLLVPEISGVTAVRIRK